MQKLPKSKHLLSLKVLLRIAKAYFSVSYFLYFFHPIIFMNLITTLEMSNKISTIIKTLHFQLRMFI